VGLCALHLLKPGLQEIVAMYRFKLELHLLVHRGTSSLVQGHQVVVTVGLYYSLQVPAPPVREVRYPLLLVPRLMTTRVVLLRSHLVAAWAAPVVR
jgi:hypothetical protein